MADPKAETDAGAENREGKSSEPPTRRIQLPASGLAEEILSMVARASHTEDPEPEESEIWVAFAIGDESFALPAVAVQEVVRVESLTRIPHASPTIRGLSTVRGKPLTVIDLGLKIGARPEPAGLTRASRILALHHRGRSIGLLVDRIGQVMNVFASRIEGMDETVTDNGDPKREQWSLGRYGLESRWTILLNSEALITLDSKSDPQARRSR